MKKNNSLPFDLSSHDDYSEMRNQLRTFILPRILANGKPSKSVRKLVTVQLFDKGMEGVSVEKGADKVSRYYMIYSRFAKLTYLTQKSTKLPGDVDKSKTKLVEDKFFEKKKRVIEQLMEHWSCETHSLPDKAALCWTPEPHGPCYPITQSNINFGFQHCL